MRKKINTNFKIFIENFDISENFRKIFGNFHIFKKYFFFIERKKYFFEVEFFFWIQFRSAKSIAFDWWHFRSDSDTPSWV